MAAMTVRLDDDNHELLRRMAYVTRHPMAQIINDALRSHLAPPAPVLDRLNAAMDRVAEIEKEIVGG